VLINRTSSILSACLLSAACTGSPSTPTAPVPVAGTATIGFNGLGNNLSPFAIQRESGHVITPAAGQWVVGTTYGRPAPYILFTRSGPETVSAEIQVIAEGAAFRFSSVDLYSSVTPIPYVFEGFLRDKQVFSTAGTVPNTFGNFATVRNPFAAEAITTLTIRLDNPAPGCVVGPCPNPVGLDNIVVGY
jgi:hypothetical protein